jgi:ribosome-binding factor A
MVQRRGSGGGRPTSGGSRGYPRTARVNENLREVIAEEIEEIDDDRLFLCTITGVQTDPDLRHATVFFSSMNPHTAAGIEPVREALTQYRVLFQKAIGRQLTLKHTPLLAFQPDSGVANGAVIEEIIRTMPRSPEGIDYGIDDDDDDDDDENDDAGDSDVGETDLSSSARPDNDN